MGKIVGMLFGVRYGGLWGALIGIVVGHLLIDQTRFSRDLTRRTLALFSPSHSLPPCPRCRQPLLPAGDGIYACPRCSPSTQGNLGRLGSRPLALHSSLLGCLVAVAKADGPLSAHEVKAIRDFYARDLGVPPRSLALIKHQLKQTARHPPDLRTAAVTFARFADHHERVLIYRACEKLAEADGPPRDSERQALLTVRTTLGLVPGDLHGPEENMEALDPYEVLGLEKTTATDETIRAAHRRLARLYHPDRVAHLAPEFQELAARRFKAIQLARDRLLEKTP